MAQPSGPTTLQAPPLLDEDDLANAQDDGPPMTVPSPPSDEHVPDDLASLRHSPMASTGFAPEGGVEVMRAMQAMQNMPSATGRREIEAEETTRAVSREELMRHQDAQFVVGADAMGDDATLAVAPGQVDLGPAGPGIAAAMQETLQRRQPSRPDIPPAASPYDRRPPSYPNPNNVMGLGHNHGALPSHGQGPGGPMAPPQHHPPPPPSWPGEAPSYRQPQQGMGPSQGMPPMHQGGPPMHQGGHGGYPSSGHQAIRQSQPGHPMGQGPRHAQTAARSYAGQPYGPSPGAQPMARRPAATTQRMTAPVGVPGLPGLTPQVILLIAVGGVCLAIFITGIILFVTTKF